MRRYPLRLTASILMIVAVALGIVALNSIAPLPSAAFQDDPATTVAPTATATRTPPPTATPTPTITPSPTDTPTLTAPTRVPPTLVPTVTPTPFSPVEVSGLSYAKDNRLLRVGTYFNAYPFSWLNENGTVAGYEADIIRAIAIDLGVEIEFVQVTRHNDVATLLSGQIDLLIGQQMHTRDREDLVEFSHPYYINQERMVVQTDSPWNDLAGMAGQPVSVELGSRSERALRDWMQETGTAYDVRPFLTESDALDALAAGDVAGMVGTLDSLRRAGRLNMRLIDEPVLNGYYAIVVRRWDVNLRNLINRSLQKLKASGRLDEIFAEWFPAESINFNALVPVYENLYEDTRALADFNADVPYPDTPVLERIAQGQPIRVAGLVTGDESAPAQARILNALNNALVNEMARRWGVQVEVVPNSALNAVDLVANGQADLAVGVSPRWDGADRVDYSLPYAQHSDRLMIPRRYEQQISGFADMLGTGWWIGYFADDAQDADLIRKYAQVFGVEQNVRDPFAIQREEDAIYTMTIEQNIDAIFGDSLRLLALLRDWDTPSAVVLLDTPYGDILPITFAVPRNDADFRALIDFTLQDMAADGTYQGYWGQHFGLGDPMAIPYWPVANPNDLS